MNRDSPMKTVPYPYLFWKQSVGLNWNITVVSDCG